MSILITSTTDIISFYTAVLAPYPYVKIFCLYTGTALLVNLIYQVEVSSCQCNLHRKCKPIENCTLEVFWIVVRENFRVYTVHLTIPNHRLGRAEDTRRVCV